MATDTEEWTSDDDEDELTPDSKVKQVNSLPIFELQILLKKVVPNMTLVARNGYANPLAWAGVC
jgi:hypothetical protein